MTRPPLRHKPNNRSTLTLARPSSDAPSSRPQSAEPPPPREKQPDLDRIGGLPAVSAIFQRDPERVERLFFEPRMAAQVQAYCQVMARAKKPYRQVPAEELTKVGGSPLHGGVVAVARPKGHVRLDIKTALSWADQGQPLVILDGVGNPHNLGAIARSMAFFGLERMIISNHLHQARISSAAQRVAEGGLEWVTVYQTDNLPSTLRQLSTAYSIIGTALGGNQSPQDCFAAQTKPIALILGNEEHGLPPDTLAACDAVVTIAGSGWVQSLNVANSAAILLHQLQSRLARSAARAK